MKQIGNRGTYVISSILFWTLMRSSFHISLLLCINPPPLLKQCYCLKIAIECAFSHPSLTLVRTNVH